MGPALSCQHCQPVLTGLGSELGEDGEPQRPRSSSSEGVARTQRAESVTGGRVAVGRTHLGVCDLTSLRFTLM